VNAAGHWAAAKSGGRLAAQEFSTVRFIAMAEARRPGKAGQDFRRRFVCARVLHFIARKNHRAAREIFNAASETISVEAGKAFCEDETSLVPTPNPVSPLSVQCF
jgi:hypothetical protein